MGRPTDYNPKIHPKVVRKLASKGLTDEDIADILGIARSTLSEWKVKHPEFRDALKEGKREPDDEIENALYRRAKGFKYTEGGKEKVSLPDTTACIFWLKNRRPKEWRDKHHTELSGSIDIGYSEAARRVMGELADEESEEEAT